MSLNTERIRQLRLQLRLTQEQAARKAGLAGRQHWNKLERAKHPNVTLAVLDRVARALGVSARDLLK